MRRFTVCDCNLVCLRRPESDVPGMGVRWAGDAGAAPEPGTRFVLRWETLGSNRDRPREDPPPEPSMLRLYRFRAGVASPVAQ